MKANKTHLLLIMVRRRLALICCCTFLAVGLAVVYCVLTPRIYQATATLLVEYNQEGLNKNNTDQPSRRFEDLATQMKVIASPVVVDRALGALQPFQLGAALAKLSPEERRVELAKNFSVTTSRNASLLNLSYQSPEPSTNTAIISAITDSYLKFIAETHRSNSREVLEILTRQKSELETQLTENDQEQLKHQQDAGVISSERERISNYEKHLSALEEELNKARAARIRAANINKQVLKASDSKDGKNLVAMRLMGKLGETVVSENMGVRSDNLRFFESTLESNIIRDEVELQRLSTVYGPDHPHFKALKSRIERNREHLKSPDATNPEAAEKREVQVTDLVRRTAAQELEEAQTIEQEVIRRIADEKALAANQNLQYLQLRTIESKGDRLKSFYDVLLKRIKELDIGENLARINVTVVGAPTPTAKPIAPNVLLIILFGLGAGLAAGLGMALLLDRLDNKFRNLEDIQQLVGASVVGTVPHFKSSMSCEPALMMSETPNAPEAEAFRSIRTWLIFRKDVRVFCVSSPLQGDGKSMVISNLACTIARAGKRTLLIDADLRRPRVQHIWRLDPSRGLAYLLLSGECTPENINAEVRASPVSNLDLLPSGRVPANPGELLEKPEMLNLLQWARSHYDYVLIDSPPLIPVADGRTIARLVDGLFLVVRVDNDSRDSTYRAKNYVSEAGGTVLGVVANGIDKWVSYGYYKHDAYGYGMMQEDAEQARSANDGEVADAA